MAAAPVLLSLHDHELLPERAEAEIRDEMRRIGHRKRGFVIYRCTYDDDAAWRRFLDINTHDRNDLRWSEAPEPLQSLDRKVFDDRRLFDGASKDRVRAHFVDWCASPDALAEQYDSASPPPPGLPTLHGQSPRYTFCIHVDAASLRSVVELAPQLPKSDFDGVGWVALIDSEWEMPDRATFDCELNGLDPETQDPTDEDEEPVEGCRTYEVGWMRMGGLNVGIGPYSTLFESWIFL